MTDADLAPFMALGYELIPLRIGDKPPRDRDWTTTPYSYAEILEWKSRGGNVGVRLRPTDLVIDYDPRNVRPEDGDVLARFQADTGIRLDDLPSVITGAGGRHWYATRTTEGPIRNALKERYGEGLEFKSVGRQVVAPGSIHPDTRNFYAWDDMGAVLDRLPPLVPPALMDLIGRRKPEGHAGLARLPVRQVLMCLDQLDPCADPYNSHEGWFELMQAVHFASGGDQEAKEAFVAWSAENPAYAGDSEQVEYRWDTLDPDFEGGVGVGTLFKHVSEAGGTPYLPASMVFEALAPQVTVSEEGERVESYEPVFERDNSSKPKATLGNCYEGIKGLGVTVKHDVFKNRTYVVRGEALGVAPWTLLDDKTVLIALRTLFLRYGFQAKVTDLHNAFDSLGLKEGKFDSLVDHLDALAWDGKPRLADWLARYCEVEPTPYVRSVGRIMVMGAVARAYEPGVQFQSMPILEGPQGIGKSTMLKILAGHPERMKEGLHSIGDKDAVQELDGKWIIEIAELSAFKKAEAEHLKAFISRDVDNCRPAYGRKSEDRPRRCIMVGTTNETGYLQDSTGNRRYLPVWLKRVNLSALAADRDQLIAEAVVAWKEDPDPVTLQMPTALYSTAAAEADLRRIEDPWEDLVQTYLGKIDEDHITTSSLFRNALGRLDGTSSRTNTSDSRRMSKAMQRLGWRKCKVSDGEGRYVNGYRREDA